MFRRPQMTATISSGLTGKHLTRAWTARSWDATQVPSPFATIGVAIGEPIVVDGITPSTIEMQRARLERELSSLERAARTLAGRS
jgi:lysophospholipid acyltransferase (LPLAT)-like uncharacterized protein